MAEPKCPECKVAGSQHIILRRHPSKQEFAGGSRTVDVTVIYCDACGHIYHVE